MDLTVAAVAALIFGLLVGLALGWFVALRPLADLRQRLAVRDGEARDLDEKFKAAIRDLASASERAAHAEALAGELAAVRADRDAARAELATLKANAAHLEEQKALLVQAQKALLEQFETAGAKVLGAAQETLLKRAREVLEDAGKQNVESIRTVLAPVGETLQKYEKQVRDLETTRADAFNQLYGQLTQLRDGQEKVREEAARLGNSLRNAPKARGRWGELQLKNLLEQCGLAEHTDFVTEHSLDTENGRLRPDAIIHIPGQKSLIVDAKVSLNAYQEAFEAQDEKARSSKLKDHADSMRKHVQQLGAKAYHAQFDEAPDYVVMFVPGEHFVAAALEHDSDLWDFAFRNKVLLATPTNLVAIARTVAMVWKQDQLAREAVEIGKAGTELYDRLATAAEHLRGMGAGLDRAVRKYNDFVGSFERNVLTSGRRLRDKGIAIGKREIEDVPMIESLPRYRGDEAPPTLAEAAD